MGGDRLEPLYVLPKDHKAFHPSGIPKSRPVVAGCSAYNSGLSELLSELLEGVFKSIEGGVGVISSEDFLANLHRLNDTISSEKFHLYNPENLDHVSGAESNTVIMVATDVVALFPSLGIEETARVCGQVVEASELEIENVDYTEMLLDLR